MTKFRLCATALATTVGTACSGAVVGHDPGPPNSAGGSGGAEEQSSRSSYQGGANDDIFGKCNDEHPDPHLRRLSNFQYERTVRSLFDRYDLGDFASGLSGDGLTFGFDTIGANQVVLRPEVERFVDAAIAVTDRLRPNMIDLMGCNSSLSVSCVEEYALGLARQAYRRPLDAEESRIVSDLIRREANASNTESAAAAAIEFVLLSPQFLYRMDEAWLQPEMKSQRVATGLAFFLWGQGPDADATQWALDHAELRGNDIETLVERMLQDDRVRASMAHFANLWLDVPAVRALGQSNTEKFPGLDQQVVTAIGDSMLRTVEHAAFDTNADIAALFNSRDIWTTDAMAQFYGHNDSQQGWRQFERPEQQAGGLLSHPGFLTAHNPPHESSPIYRGVFVRDRILCGALPSPPPNIPELPEIDPGASVRQVHEQHMAQPLCRSCHELIDPVGFAFENFDGAGRWREAYADAPIDASGYITAGDDASGDYTDFVGFAERISASQRLRACVALQATRYARGLEFEDYNNCAVRHVIDRRQDNAMTLIDLFRELALEIANTI